MENFSCASYPEVRKILTRYLENDCFFYGTFQELPIKFIIESGGRVVETYGTLKQMLKKVTSTRHLEHLTFRMNIGDVTFLFGGCHMYCVKILDPGDTLVNDMYYHRASGMYLDDEQLLQYRDKLLVEYKLKKFLR